jgi:hypothetical protein
MTILFPRLNSRELGPFVAPFGRMMLAFGRAAAAAVELGCAAGLTEADAVLMMGRDAHELPKRLAGLLEGKLAEADCVLMNEAAARYKEVAEKRHHLVHGEWWFNVFAEGRLEVRKVWKGGIEHLDFVTPDTLDLWATTLEEIADDLDAIEYRVRRSPPESVRPDAGQG